MFFETTIMGTWQWSRRRTLTPSTKRVSHRRPLLKGVAVHRVLYQSILNAKLTGRKNLGRKRCTSNRDDCKLENTVKQSRFKHLGELHKEWTEAESVHQESPHSDVFRKRATKPLLKQKQRQKHLTWLWRKRTGLLLSAPKSSFQIKVNFAFNCNRKSRSGVWSLEDWRGTHNPSCLKSSVKFRVSQWWFGVPWRLLVLVHCVSSSPKSMQLSTRRFWSTVCFHLLTSFMEMLIAFSSRTLAPAHSAKTTSKWFADHDITVLDWPANMPDLNPIWNLWNIFKRKMRNSRSNNPDELKAQ